MNGRDETILRKMRGYCDEAASAHRFFRDDRALFLDEREGAVYRNAVAMPVLQIGELAKNLSEDFRGAHKTIPWQDIIRMRDLFAHHYGAVDYEQLWDTSHSDMENLRVWIDRIAVEGAR